MNDTKRELLMQVITNVMDNNRAEADEAVKGLVNIRLGEMMQAAAEETVVV